MRLPDTAGPTCLFHKLSQVAAVWLQLTHTLKPGLCPTLYLTHQSQTTSFATQLHKANLVLHTVSHIEKYGDRFDETDKSSSLRFIYTVRPVGK